MKANYHTHCAFCDGREEPEAILSEALKRGFDALGFSSHAPMKGEEDWTLDEEAVPLYAGQIRALQERYRDRIALFLGLERDFLVTEPLWEPRSWKGTPLDYVIGSVHMLFCREERRYYGIDGPLDELTLLLEKEFDGDSRDLVETYYEQVRLMVSRETFDFVGHLDVIKKWNGEVDLFHEDYPWYKAAVNRTLDVIADRGLRVEINTGGLARKDVGELYPSPAILGECRKRDIPILINSDAHSPEHLDAYFAEAEEAARKAGYRERWVLDRGGWRSVPLG